VKRGRPKKNDAVRFATIIHAVRQGANDDLAARAGGISKNTLHRWLAQGENMSKNSPMRKFHDEFQKAVGERAVAWLEVVDSAAKKGNWVAAAWKLERCHPQIFGKFVKQERSGPNGGPQEVQNTQVNLDVRKLSGEQLEQLERIIQSQELGSGTSREAADRDSTAPAWESPEVGQPTP
jgi:transposase-like protein